ncbi:hypothetical protein M0812_19147 [Anaeramoeba flamelloides]|uniref:Uncharacterized protein n=1 Tax=Anaeramoeba flamelloides TaxID=1746091 RepID=A0AAV7Z7R6_9EUKA|nr:hypothetical protein M0812_19147 [Anaeramoeba flamelloides]
MNLKKNININKKEDKDQRGIKSKETEMESEKENGILFLGLNEIIIYKITNNIEEIFNESLKKINLFYHNNNNKLIKMEMNNQIIYLMNFENQVEKESFLFRFESFKYSNFFYQIEKKYPIFFNSITFIENDDNNNNNTNSSKNNDKNDNNNSNYYHNHLNFNIDLSVNLHFIQILNIHDQNEEKKNKIILYDNINEIEKIKNENTLFINANKKKENDYENEKENRNGNGNENKNENEKEKENGNEKVMKANGIDDMVKFEKNENIKEMGKKSLQKIEDEDGIGKENFINMENLEKSKINIYYSISICNKKQKIKKKGKIILKIDERKILIILESKKISLPITFTTTSLIHPKNKKIYKFQSNKSSKCWYILFDSIELCDNFFKSVTSCMKKTFIKFNVMIFDKLETIKSKGVLIFNKDGLHVIIRNKAKGHNQGNKRKVGKEKSFEDLEELEQQEKNYFKFSVTNLKLFNEKPLICKISSPGQSLILKFASIKKREKFSTRFFNDKNKIKTNKNKIIIKVKILKGSIQEFDFPKIGDLILQKKSIVLKIENEKKIKFNFNRKNIKIIQKESKKFISKIYLGNKNKFVFEFKNHKKQAIFQNYFKK